VPIEKKSKELNVEELQSWKLLGEFRSLLADAPPSAASQPSTKGGPARLLQEDDYLCAFLFAQFNPVISSMRGLCACSKFQKVQDEVCRRSMSLGSFSEAQSVFGFERLEGIFQKLASENIRQSRPGSEVPTHLLKALRLVDSSVFRAVPRMAWAHWRQQHKAQSAVRLHLSFALLDEKTANASITSAKVCERKALELMIKPGEFYVGDRYYGRDYQFLNRLSEAGCSYLIRLREDSVMEVVEELPLVPADVKAGVVSDRIVRLGSRTKRHPGLVRIIRIEKPELDEPLILVTNQLSPTDLGAALLAGIYKQRWEIELFFRWLKCVFGRRKQWHWFAESENGVGIQLYSAMIAALLLSRRLGKLPGKRLYEALQFHQAGWVSEAELAAILPRNALKKTQ
jgi:hypothetical protein